MVERRRAQREQEGDNPFGLPPPWLQTAALSGGILVIMALLLLKLFGDAR